MYSFIKNIYGVPYYVAEMALGAGGNAVNGTEQSVGLMKFTFWLERPARCKRVRKYVTCQTAVGEKAPYGSGGFQEDGYFVWSGWEGRSGMVIFEQGSEEREWVSPAGVRTVERSPGTTVPLTLLQKRVSGLASFLERMLYLLVK